ncbi:hypothetical protein D9M69_533530 [compost metagenome]
MIEHGPGVRPDAPEVIPHDSGPIPVTVRLVQRRVRMRQHREVPLVCVRQVRVIVHGRRRIDPLLVRKLERCPRLPARDVPLRQRGMVRPAWVARQDHAQRDARSPKGQRQRVDHGQLWAFARFIHHDQREGHALNRVL